MSPLRAVAQAPMVLHTMTVHPRGILPAQAAKAWYLRVKAKKKWREIQEEVVNAAGGTPSEHALENAVARMKSRKPHGVPKYKYQNCGVKKMLTKRQDARVVAFVKKWRAKRFCTCEHIIREMKLRCSTATVSRCLNRNGFFWKAGVSSRS